MATIPERPLPLDPPPTPSGPAPAGPTLRAALAATAAAVVVLELLAEADVVVAPHLRILGLPWNAASTAALLAALLVLAGSARRLGPRAPLAAAALLALLSVAVPSARDLTASLHPVTDDLVVLAFEAPLGSPAPTLAGLAAGWLAAGTALALLGALPLVLVTAAWVSRRRRGAAGPDPLAAAALAALLAALLNHALPAVGPPLLAAAVPGHVVGAAGPLPPPAWRAAVPGLAVAWAAVAALSVPGSTLALVAWASALAAALSAMVLGQGYVLSALLALPLAGAALALCAPGTRAARLALGVDAALLVATVAGLRLAPATAAALAWPLALACLGLPPWLERRRQAEAPPTPPPAEPAEATRGLRAVTAMFLASGAAGLVYEVVFAKQLALTFGSQATASQTVLATYMGGIALGTWLGGRAASRTRDPLRLYAWSELGIGLCCAVAPWLFGLVRRAYVALAVGADPSSSALTALQVLLGALVLLPPTVLMGVTLPALARFLERSQGLGRAVGLLYAANTGGAAAGALATGYWLLPALGVAGTTSLAVLANLGIALLALLLRSRGAGAPDDLLPAPAATGERPAWSTFATGVLFLGGIVSLGLEVVCIHLLAVVAGNSAYAFSLMLCAFLLGLGAGAAVARRLLRPGRALPALGLGQLLLAASILAGVFLWDEVPRYFGTFAAYPLSRSFAAREVVRAAVCLLAMLPPAFFVGAAFTFAMDLVGAGAAGSRVGAVGRAAALNTVGNILGVLLVGFVLLPRLGALSTLHALAALAAALGAVATALAPRRQRGPGLAAAGAVLALALLQPAAFDAPSLVSGANVYFVPRQHERVLDLAESLDGGLTAVVENPGPDGERVRTLLTNGKFQGDDALRGEVPAQFGFAICPLLHTTRRGEALVIGYGTGASTRVMHDAGFAHLDVVDLSADVFRLADRWFAAVNGGVTGRPRVRTHVTDGRNFLLLTERRYDIVSLEVSSIWFAGAASLYNREFYGLVREKLAPGGVLQQWVQLHHLSPADVLSILASIRAEFPYVTLYFVGNQGVAVASREPRLPDPEAMARLDSDPDLAFVREVFGGSVATLLPAQILRPEELDRLLAATGVPLAALLSTDDNLRLEYSTPRGNARDGRESLQANLALLASVRPVPAPGP